MLKNPYSNNYFLLNRQLTPPSHGGLIKKFIAYKHDVTC